MSEKSSEYLKRTCLICGCHTNQTINIYEPRSGPNIVELIQAKFKFQPLNEDKYLCFSCNNWLINWHSLQALNSNDAESPSGNFRPQMNSMFHKEKAESQRQKSLHSQTNVQLCRPTAKVHPLRITEKSHNKIGTEGFVLANHFSPQKILVRTSKRITKYQWKFRSRVFYFKKRRIQLKYGRIGQKFMQYKSSTGYKLDLSGQPNKLLEAAPLLSLKIPTFKKKTRHFLPNKEQYTKDIMQKLKYLKTDISFELYENTKAISNNRQYLKRPLVDGKVVSMLRRLGTTLSYENETTKMPASMFPRIMSPTKLKPQWTRQLDRDEILLGFDSAISEVLPQVINKQQQKSNGDKCVPEIMAMMQAKRRLMYQVSSISKDNSECVYPLLPEGLSISLV